MPNKNNMCDGSHCLRSDGEVRVLATSKSSNAILCNACFHFEIGYRKGRNKDLGSAFQFKLPDWEDLKVYEPWSEHKDPFDLMCERRHDGDD